MEEVPTRKFAINSVSREIYPNVQGLIALGDKAVLHSCRIHEVMGNSADVFALFAASRTSGPVVWIADQADNASFSPTGAQSIIDPTRIISVACVSRAESLWATEQALRMGGIGAVVVELWDGPSLKESRRLQLAAEEGGVLGVILIAGRAQTSATQTRWFCKASSKCDAKWVWEMIKNKNGLGGVWRVDVADHDELKYASDLVLMAATTAA